MKKFLTIFGSFILFLITMGTMFKLMHWPGSGPLLVLGMTLFSALFLPLFFIERMVSKPSALNITTNIFGLISTSMLFVGVLFKIMHWPGAGPMVVFGAFFFIFPTLILYVVQQFKEYDRKFREFWRTVVLAILTSVFLIFWGMNVTRGVLLSFLKVEDATLQTNKNLTEFNNYLLMDISSVHDSNTVYKTSAENIAKQSGEMLQYIENIKAELIMHIERNPNAIENHWDINSKDNYDIPTHYLCGEGGKGQELFDQLTQFKAMLTEEMKTIPMKNAEEKMQQLGNLGIQMELTPELMEDESNWQRGMFDQQVLSATLALLTSLQTEVLNAEFKCLSTIKMNMH